MSFQLLQIRDLSLDINLKNLFSAFSVVLYSGQKIALIGRNGAGKSSLLRILSQDSADYCGEIIFPKNISIEYVSQILSSDDNKSGGEILMDRLQNVFDKNPDILLLDEPTNHLDNSNRKFLEKMISKFKGCLIVATHDEEFIENYFDYIWHIDHG